jgi:hypothetical protein
MNIDLLRKKLKQKIEKFGYDSSELYGQLHVKIEGRFIPLVVLEDCPPSFLEPKVFAIIIYYHFQEANKMFNIYTEKRMIDIGDFLKQSKEDLDKLLALHVSYIDEDSIRKIKSKIELFAKTHSDSDFEKEVTNLFSLLRNKSKELETMLIFFNYHKNIPLGKKPIHIGGNNRSDIEFIELFGYFNALLNLGENKSADAKRYYSSHITNATITDKVKTNYGKEIIIVTNSDKVDPGAWSYIWNSYKEHGNWKFFILDLDLLSLIIYHLGLKELFQ